MQDTQATSPSIKTRAERAFNDLVVAELFMVQATIESAILLGDGISEIRDHLTAEDASDSTEELSAVIKRNSEKVIEPYSARIKELRELFRNELAA